jgi:hypothetical protein
MSMNRLVLGSLSPALAPLARDAPGHTLCSALPPACLPWQGLWGGGKESVPPWRTEIFQLEDLAGWPSWIPLAPPGRRERGTDARARGRARSPSPRGRAVPEDARSPSLPPGWAPRSLRASPGFCCWEVSGEPGSAERGVGRRVTGLGVGLVGVDPLEVSPRHADPHGGGSGLALALPPGWTPKRWTRAAIIWLQFEGGRTSCGVDADEGAVRAPPPGVAGQWAGPGRGARRLP